MVPDCKSTHCIIHGGNVAIKEMSPEFNSILSEVVKIVNHVKANALSSRLLLYYVKMLFVKRQNSFSNIRTVT